MDERSNFHSSANLFQILVLNSIGDSAESMPARVMPLKINGKTVVFTHMPATFPQQAITHIGDI